MCSVCNREIGLDSLIPMGSEQVCIACKDIHVQRIKEGVTDSDSEIERIREEHLTHETNLKGIGALMILGSVLMGIGVLGTAASRTLTGVEIIIPGLLLLVVFWLGIQYRRLSPSVRIPGTLFACIGLLGFPVGTLLNGFVLYLIHSEKGKMVLSKDYQAIVAATPHIKYKTSKVAWAVLIIIVVVIVVGIVLAALS